MNWRVLQGDAKDLPLPDEHVEAVVCDPPYGLEFMGKAWDHGVPGVPFWEEALRVLKPGGHLLAFGGTRTHHRLMVAIEDAGFEIRDTLSWMYGTGFPKSYDIAQSIEKKIRTGKCRRPDRDLGDMSRDRWSGDHPDEDGAFADTGGKVELTTDAGKRWEGQGTNLKPGWEPIVLAMKPLDGTFAENALEHGVAGLNVDGCRIGTETISKHGYPGNDQYGSLKGKGSMDADPQYQTSEGRWPANVLLSHTAACERVGTKRVEAEQQGSRGESGEGWGMRSEDGHDYADEDGKETVEDWSCPPTCPVRMLDEQSGELDLASSRTKGEPREGATNFQPGPSNHIYDDPGGASRFYYCAKASRSEREAGLPDVGGRYNQHPTVKPIELCRWLVRLVTRPEHMVLDPFMGSGSIGCAAVQERRDFIGLDKSREYVELAEKRIAHWEPKQRDMFLDREAS